MRLSTDEKKELAKKFNISLSTFYNWEKEKPYLYKIILLGLEREEEKNNEEEYSIKELYEGYKELKEEIAHLKTIK